MSATGFMPKHLFGVLLGWGQSFFGFSAPTPKGMRMDIEHKAKEREKKGAD
jgi:hypothetical protein